jgi:hypothetical protein
MFNDPGGYFVDEARSRPPVRNFIDTVIGTPTAPYTSASTRQARLGLGSASLGSGFSFMASPDRQIRSYRNFEWWYDEYAVDLSSGQASTQLANTGWLGQPLAPYYQMIWTGSNPDAVTNPGFETDLTGWSMGTVIGSTMIRDVSTAAVGTASAHITVPTAGTVSWATAFSTTGMIPVTGTYLYSATFWAKAATPRSINVVLGGAVSGELASRALSLDTTWKQYQVALIAQGSGTARLGFYVGGQAGDVWFDVVVRDQDYPRMRANTVRFSPCARTAWHSHPGGQTLYVVEGRGRVQSRGVRSSSCAPATSSTPRPAKSTGMAPRPITS